MYFKASQIENKIINILFGAPIKCALNQLSRNCFEALFKCAKKPPIREFVKLTPIVHETFHQLCFKDALKPKVKLRWTLRIKTLISNRELFILKPIYRIHALHLKR
jgi:hypothetical protein